MRVQQADGADRSHSTRYQPAAPDAAAHRPTVVVGGRRLHMRTEIELHDSRAAVSVMGGALVVRF
ncbi:MAG: hypothetical protein Q8M65_02075, partial [Rhodoglobus sp.]|nr:hypothetical protein [Rhodoglobus sp.]